MAKPKRTIRQENDRLFLWLVIGGLIIGGGGTIALVYGASSLLTALPCLLGGAALIFIPWGVLAFMERWQKRRNEADRALWQQAREEDV